MHSHLITWLTTIIIYLFMQEQQTPFHIVLHLFTLFYICSHCFTFVHIVLHLFTLFYIWLPGLYNINHSLFQEQQTPLHIASMHLIPFNYISLHFITWLYLFIFAGATDPSSHCFSPWQRRHCCSSASIRSSSRFANQGSLYSFAHCS